MKKICKKIVCVLLTMLIVLGSVPLGVLAAPVQDDVEQPSVGAVPLPDPGFDSGDLAITELDVGTKAEYEVIYEAIKSTQHLSAAVQLSGGRDLSNSVVVDSMYLRINGDSVICEEITVQQGDRLGLDFSWSVEAPDGDFLQDGDWFRIAAPVLVPTTGSGSFYLSSLQTWFDFTTLSGIVGEFRHYGGYIEVVITDAREYEVSAHGNIDIGRVIDVLVTTPGTGNVYFTGPTGELHNWGSVNFDEDPDGGGTEPGDAVPYKTNIGYSPNMGFVAWILNPHPNGLRELGESRGYDFTRMEGFYIEDTFKGTVNSIDFFMRLYVPHSLACGRPSNQVAINLPINNIATRVFPGAGESYVAFRARLEPFEFGVWESPTGEQTFVMYLGTLGEDGELKYTDLPFGSNIWGVIADNVISISDRFTFLDRVELVNYFSSAFGDNNTVGGRIVNFRIQIVENVGPFAVDTYIPNYMRLEHIGPYGTVNREYNDTVLLRGVRGGLGSVPGDRAQLVLRDEITNEPIEGVEFQLERYTNGVWEPVPDRVYVTDDLGWFVTNPLPNGTYRLVQLGAEPPFYLPGSRDYVRELGTVVSDEFTLVATSPRGPDPLEVVNIRRFVVTYILQNDDPDETEYVIHNQFPDDVPTGFERPGYAFVGWGEAPNATTFVDPTTVPIDDSRDFRFYAIWAPVFDITYEFIGDVVPPNVTEPDTRYRIVVGTQDLAATPVTSPVTGLRDGVIGEFTFGGWQADNVDNSANFTMPNGDVEFRGVWTFTPRPLNITYGFTTDVIPPGVTAPPDREGIAAGTPDLSATPVEPDVRQGYHNGVRGEFTFGGWSADNVDDPENFRMPNEDVTFRGEWTFTPVTVYIRYEFYNSPIGATNVPDVPDERRVEAGSEQSATEVTPRSVRGYNEVGVPGTWILSDWEADNVETPDNFVMPNDDVTFRARWVFTETPTIGKTSTSGTAIVGETIEYVITVTNNNTTALAGYFTVTDEINIALVEYLPDTLSIMRGGIDVLTEADVAFNSGTGVLTIRFNGLPESSVTEISFSVRVLEAAAGQTIVNSANLDVPGDLPPPPEPPPVITPIPKITKAAPNASTARVGDSVRYVISVINNSDHAWERNHVVVDNLDTRFVLLDQNSVRVTFANGTALPSAAYTLNIAPGGVRVVLHGIPANTTIEISFNVTVLPAAEGETITNVALLLDENDEELAPPAEVDVPVIIAPSIEKQANDGNDDEIPVGGSIAYTITVDNPNDFALIDYVVVDELNTRFVSLNPTTVRINGVSVADADMSFEEGVLRVYLRTLAPGYTIVTFEVTVLLPAADYGTVRNVAYLYGPPAETDDPTATPERPQIDSDHAVVRVEPIEAPSIEKKANVETAYVGDRVLYTITVDNPNDFALLDYVVVDELNTIFVRFERATLRVNNEPVADADMSFEGGVLRVYLRTLAPGYTIVTFEVTVLIPAAGDTVVNVAQLLGPPTEPSDPTEPTVRPPVGEPTPPVEVDVWPIEAPSIEKKANVEIAYVGDRIRYTIRVDNPNNFALLDYVVVDELNTAFVRFERDSLRVNDAPVADTDMSFDRGVLRVHLHNLAPGETRVIFEVTVLMPAAGDTVINVAQLLGPPTDPSDPTDPPVRPPVGEPTPPVDVIVPGTGEPTIRKSANVETARVGERVTYTITVNNPNAVEIIDYVVVDELNTTFVRFERATLRINGEAVADTDMSFEAGQLRVYLQSLALGATTVTFEVTVLQAAAGNTVRNIAVLEGPPTEPSDPEDPTAPPTRPPVGDPTPPVDVIVPPIQDGTPPDGGGGGGGVGGGGTPPVEIPPVVPPAVPPVTPPDVGSIFSPYHNAFIVGFPDGTVSPLGQITRAEVVTVLFRLLDDDFRASVWSQQNDFADVATNAWFNNAVSTMVNAGIISANSSIFRPNDPVTRAEFAAMVARFFTEFEATQNAFSDVQGNWAEDYINLIAQFGWVQGDGGGAFNPNANMTRAEAAAIVNRMLDRILVGPEGLLEGRIRWPDKTNINAWYYLYLQEATHSTLFERTGNGTLRWTELLPHLDWTVLERPTSTPGAIRTERQIQREGVA